MIKTYCLHTLLLTTLLIISHSVTAAQAPTGDGWWYYEIGGAQPVLIPANPSVVAVTLGGSA